MWVSRAVSIRTLSTLLSGFVSALVLVPRAEQGCPRIA